MKRILHIGTGGTIASEIKDGSLAPGLTSGQLMRYVPEIFNLCEVACIQPLCLDSTNIMPEHWIMLTRIIRDEYKNYDGFVITHGTDTMAYTASALSYLIQGSGKPIVLTGAQKPIGSEITDSRRNLQDAFLCAASDEICSVVIVFNGRVIFGTRAKKTRTKSFEAFESINYPDAALVTDGRLFCYIRNESREAPLFYDKLDTNVALVKLIPGTKPEVLAWLLAHNDALVVESFGVGGLPDNIRDVVGSMPTGKTLILTTQVQNEGSDIAVYSVGNALKKTSGILEAYDMTTESACAKMMWILGQTNDPAQVRRLFYTPVGYDLLNRG